MHSRGFPFHRTISTRLYRFALAFALCIACSPAWSQDFSKKPIRLVVGFPPGGSNDIVARIIAPRLGEILGTSVVIENRPGANATIGSDLVAKAIPDGHTLLVASSTPLVIVPHTFAKVPYNTLTDFAPITTICVTPGALTINPSLPIRDLKELINLARTKEVTLASSGNGGIAHLAIELFKTASGGKVVHVPFSGAAPAINSVLGGHVNGIVVDLAALYALIKDGRLRALAVASEQRSEFLPDVPTAAEQGLPAFVAINWIGLLAPPKTPRAVVDKIHAAMIKATQMPQMKDQFTKVAVSPSTMASPERFHQYLKEEFAKWGKIAKQSGARSD